MKAVLKETKRIMAVLLSVAMIFAYVPETVFTYGANVTDETVEQMSEETSEQASEQNEEPSSEAPSEEPTTEAPAEEIEEEPIAEKAGDGAEDVIEDGEAITDEKEDAVLRGMTLDGDPSSLDDLKYGDEPGNVTITAKQTVSGTTTTYRSEEHTSELQSR